MTDSGSGVGGGAAGIVPLLRRARNAAYVALGPFDWCFRRLNGLEKYPPIHLRRYVSCLGSLDGPGFEFVAYLKLLAGLRAGGSLWDVGCGCGLLELALENSGWAGRITGNDIHLPSIRWATRHINARVPSFEFIHSNIRNEAYWPSGRLDAASWFDSFDRSGFDAVLAKSLFTHMLPSEVDLYLAQIARRLAPGGRALLTFFLLNEQSLSAPAAKMSFVRMSEGDTFAVRRKLAPTAAVAYDEAALMDRMGRAGLVVHDIKHGTWSGRADGLSFQDIVIVGR